MTLHNPKNLKLPPLEVEKQQDRKLTESDSAVRNLIDSDLLLNKDLIYHHTRDYSLRQPELGFRVCQNFSDYDYDQ